MVATAALYIIGLGASGWANSFYSAAAQAGSQSWKAWFFGSLDSGNAITVDKPPAALWIMGLSVRLFGLNSWSILVPEALEGVAAVTVVYFTIRRVLSGVGWRTVNDCTTRAHWTALAGAAMFATVPSATLMFRFNNPDALLVLLLCVASYCVLRATEKGARRWLVWAGVAIGFAFLTKTLQAFLLLPVFVLVHALTAPRTWRQKIVDQLAALGAIIVSAGWYVAIFELVPKSWRPYMGGSQNNSFIELALGYNGLGRITGNETGSVTGGGGGGVGSWGQTGITRLFDGVSAGMVTWLIPAAIILCVVAVGLLGRGAWANVRATRESMATARTQTLAGIGIFGGWLVITYLVFAFMSGIYHDYYTVALAPAIGAATALGAGVCWAERDRVVARTGMATATAVTTVWGVVLLSRAGSSWFWAGAIVGVAGAMATLGLLFVNHLNRHVARVALALAVIAGMTGPLGYSVSTAATPHTGSIVTAGPVSGGGPGSGPGRGQGGPGRGGPGQTGGGQAPGATGQNPQVPNGQGGTTGGAAPNGQGGTPPNGQDGTNGQNGTTPNGQTGTARGTAPGRGGGLLGGATVSSQMTALLQADASSYTWVAATVGSQTAASYQLAAQEPVMSIGGFNGSDNYPTLAQFKQMVAEKKIHYFIAGSLGGRQNGGSQAASQIQSWVSSTFTARTVDGTTVYDLTGATS